MDGAISLREAIEKCSSDNIYIYNFSNERCKELFDNIDILNSANKYFSLPYEHVSIVSRNIDNGVSTICVVEAIQRIPSIIMLRSNIYSEKNDNFLNVKIELINEKGEVEISMKTEGPLIGEISEDEAARAATALREIVNVFIVELSIKSCLVGKRNHTFKVAKKKYISRDVSYVVNKKYIKSVHGNKDISWSHSFSVCGHWRKVRDIGKDRSGEYVIEGSTWVKPSIKNKDLAFKSKLKIMR